MTEFTSKYLSLVLKKTLARFFSLDLPSNTECRYLVYRAEDTPNPELAWEKRIVELAEGRPVKEIIQVLYQEQLSRGARLVDIGIWKSIFDRSVINTIGDLLDRGVIRMILSGRPGRRNAMTTTGQKRKSRLTNGGTPGGTTLSRRAGHSTSQRYQNKGKAKSREVPPQKWVAGSPTPEYGGSARTLETIQSSQESRNSFHSSQSVTPSRRSVPGLVLEFLVRVARRGSVGVNEHLDRTKGSEGG